MNISWGTKFSKKIGFTWVLRILCDFLQTLVRISNRGAKTANYMIGEPFEEKQLLWKKFILGHFRTLRRTFSAGLLKKLPTFLEETFHGKNFPFENYAIFGLMQKFFRNFGKNAFARWSKLHFSCPEEHVSWKKLLSKRVDFFKLGPWRKFCVSFAEHFRQVIENCALGVHRNTL